MSDLISRQDAIKAIEDVTWYHQNRKGDMVSGANDTEHQAWYKSQDIYDALESLPSAEVVLQTPQTYGKSINQITENIARMCNVCRDLGYIGALADEYYHDSTGSDIADEITTYITDLFNATTIRGSEVEE